MVAAAGIEAPAKNIDCSGMLTFPKMKEEYIIEYQYIRQR